MFRNQPNELPATSSFAHSHLERVVFSLDQWRNGWIAGTGLEYKVARNIGLGLEYSFIDLGSQHYHTTTMLGAPVNIVDHDVQVQSVTGRLNFHF
jgi:opacity protein-like surface antigen